MVKTEDDIWDALYDVKDPEIPVLSIIDLGIVTSVDILDDKVTIILTPTFAGCPALHYIENDVKAKLKEIGVENFEVKTTFDGNWSSNSISNRGLEVLKEFGLAVPNKHDGDFDLKTISEVNCPYCGSEKTQLKSMFGPTLCRALHYCNNCLQAFEQFKPL